MITQAITDFLLGLAAFLSAILNYETTRKMLGNWYPLLYMTVTAGLIIFSYELIKTIIEEKKKNRKEEKTDEQT